jgi:hypothetical protein
MAAQKEADRAADAARLSRVFGPLHVHMADSTRAGNCRAGSISFFHGSVAVGARLPGEIPSGSCPWTASPPAAADLTPLLASASKQAQAAAIAALARYRRWDACAVPAAGAGPGVYGRLPDGRLLPIGDDDLPPGGGYVAGHYYYGLPVAEGVNRE